MAERLRKLPVDNPGELSPPELNTDCEAESLAAAALVDLAALANEGGNVEIVGLHAVLH